MPELTAAERETLTSAQANLMTVATQGVHRLPPDFTRGTPEGFALNFDRTLGEVQVLQHYRAGVAALPMDGTQAAELQATLRNFDREIDRGLSLLRAYSAYSGATNDQQIAQLQRVQALADRQASTVGVQPESRQAALTLQSDLQSEITTRRGRDFGTEIVKLPGSPEYQSSLTDVDVAVRARQNMGRFIRDDATTVLAREPDPKTVSEVRQLTEELQAKNLELHIYMDEASLQRSQDEINHIRMGSSDTIQGKSGGGEKAGGADQATRNWLEASDRAREIALSGRPITLAQIQGLNRILNQNMPANDGTPGQFRDKTETAGGGSQYPYPEHVPQMMEEYVRWFEQNQHRDPIELAGLSYQKLVSIHPFDDANGRTCRLVADAILQSRGLPPASYTSAEVNLAVFGQPQGGTQNITPDQAIQTVGTAVRRSVGIMQRHQLAIEQGQEGPSTSSSSTSHSHSGPSSSSSSSTSQSHPGPPQQTVRDALKWTRGNVHPPGQQHSHGTGAHPPGHLG
ncbi:Fic family protein [Roseimicrobium sp. ORNL1]|uniref:Fic family protein n=1 Tax=Roseimicrobium sp. ORNL1 TaxID=2711231 RepID=UPI0013E0F7A4|nr:Fic family protein [Roseimicrobium sp. ORNL1]QIF03530.1 Fic family protein [Roseimicrobium sp. ORNL1]